VFATVTLERDELVFSGQPLRHSRDRERNRKIRMEKKLRPISCGGKGKDPSPKVTLVSGDPSLLIISAEAICGGDQFKNRGRN